MDRLSLSRFTGIYLAFTVLLCFSCRAVSSFHASGGGGGSGRLPFVPNLPRGERCSVPSGPASGITSRRILLPANANDNEEGASKKKKREGEPKKSSNKNKKRKMKPDSGGKEAEQLAAEKKEELLKAVGEEMRSRTGQAREKAEGSLLDRFNPFKAGQNLRKTLDTAITSIKMDPERKAMYYLDDRLADSGGSGPTLTERNPLLDRLDQDDFIPEVLIVGATGEVGRLVVRRLRLEGRCRVRVLVRNLYTETLNLLGTGVTYCQGDLNNIDSLEYAVTDVDKIVFCASAPRPDEDQFQERFEEYMKEMLESEDAEVNSLQNKLEKVDAEQTLSDREWEQLESVLEVRARLAEQVDCIGLQNLVRAYQNVRHADYGTSQAAKRSLFKFQGRPEDFNLFAIDQGDDDVDKVVISKGTNDGDNGSSLLGSYNDDDVDDDDDEYDDDDYEYDEYEAESLEERRDATVKTQCQWIRNQFEHGVFVGKVPKAAGGVGGEASIVSSRLRSREDPDNGIDLSVGFGGFICRVCSNGRTYEAFVRTKEYYENGIEYVCQFSTATKPKAGKNKSSNKFVTVRLPFESFKPVKRRNTGQSSAAGNTDDDTVESVPPFRGSDVRNIGFRYRSSSNELASKFEPGEWSSFYLALCYIKLFRTQPEPEFVYLSDARIPPVIHNGMVSHKARQLLTANSKDGDGGAVVRILDESTLQGTRSQEETYFKFRGEEILKNSGLSYAIVRVSGFNESPSGEASTIDLRRDNDNLTPVSRADVAQVCASALLDPNALNKSFYVSKKQGSRGSSSDEDMKSKFEALPRESVV